MIKIKKYVTKLSNAEKTKWLIVIFTLTLFLSIFIPSLARYRNRNTIAGISVWDGSVATKYREGNGSESNPYIISNGAELAYFSNQLQTTDYSNTYFKLKNDIVLNDGVFNYNLTDGIKYILNNNTYYLDEYTNNYYDNVDNEGSIIGSINKFNSLNNFKGYFNGNSYTIYGLYITDSSASELALFTNLQGQVHNLYVENSMIYGGNITGGIAAKSYDAALTNVLYNGYVVGNTNISNKTINTSINNQSFSVGNLSNITVDLPLIDGQIVSSSISGKVIITGDNTVLSINNQVVNNGTFEIDLGTSLMTNIPITSESTNSNSTIELTDLTYKITYNYAIAGGLIASGSNTSITNSINKADVYGNLISGGLIGVAKDVSINQSYNTGNINSSNIGAGLVGIIRQSNNALISSSYNSGSIIATINGGLVGSIEHNNSATLSKVFNASVSDNAINSILDSNVSVTNSYIVSGNGVGSGTVSGNFISTSIANLQNQNYVQTNLEYNYFIDSIDLANHHQNVWIYEIDRLPILFIDDISNPIANIHAGTYTWNNFTNELNTKRMDSSITFSIEEVSNLRPIKETYYYIQNSNNSLTRNELEQINNWHTYNDIVQITEEGFYIVYAKVVDFNNNVYYLNTDLLVLDLSGANISISLDDNVWDNLKTNLDKVYISEDKEITVAATDDLSGVSAIKYYISENVLNSGELENIEWNDYSSAIAINQVGKYIIYIKVIDNSDHVIYANTDYIIYDGYTEESLTLGRNKTNLENGNYITSNSSIVLKTTYVSEYQYTNNATHNLISNVLLPVGSKIIIIDNTANNKYQYKITNEQDLYGYSDSCEITDSNCIKKATYPLELFTEVGKVTNNHFSDEFYYNKTINEDFDIILDLSDTDINVNYNDVSLYMELRNENSISVGSTLTNTIKSFNIYSNTNGDSTSASLYLESSFNSQIELNSNSSTSIPISTGINYKYINDKKINDTSYEDKIIGLAIKLVDSNNNVVAKDYYKNLKFKIGNTSYYPDNDNITYINLNNGILVSNTAIDIITSEDNMNLIDGNYSLLISNYAAYDGLYSTEIGDTVSIPLTVTSGKDNSQYGFDVVMDNTKRIIEKSSNNVSILFNIMQNGLLESPNIRISLYKKDQFTAYNQDYSLVDLANFISNNLTKVSDNTYYAVTNPLTYDGTSNTYNNLELNLLPGMFNETGYKFVFELYDSNKKIGKIEKYFIVK